jgi:hypothetical protein
VLQEQLHLEKDWAVVLELDLAWSVEEGWVVEAVDPVVHLYRVQVVLDLVNRHDPVIHLYHVQVVPDLVSRHDPVVHLYRAQKILTLVCPGEESIDRQECHCQAVDAHGNRDRQSPQQ